MFCLGKSAAFQFLPAASVPVVRMSMSKANLAMSSRYRVSPSASPNRLSPSLVLMPSQFGKRLPPSGSLVGKVRSKVGRPSVITTP
ncbi:hypothetical protein D3C85_1380750 [compost metagenome]